MNCGQIDRLVILVRLYIFTCVHIQVDKHIEIRSHETWNPRTPLSQALTTKAPGSTPMMWGRKFFSILRYDLTINMDIWSISCTKSSLSGHFLKCKPPLYGHNLKYTL